jgi:hypothetical protein
MFNEYVFIRSAIVAEFSLVTCQSIDYQTLVEDFCQFAKAKVLMNELLICETSVLMDDTKSMLAAAIWSHLWEKQLTW